MCRPEVYKHPRFSPSPLEEDALDRLGRRELDLRSDPGFGVQRLADNPSKASVVTKGTDAHHEPIGLVIPGMRLDDEILDPFHRQQGILDGLRIQRCPLDLESLLFPAQDRTDARSSAPAGTVARVP